MDKPKPLVPSDVGAAVAAPGPPGTLPATVPRLPEPARETAAETARAAEPDRAPAVATAGLGAALAAGLVRAASARAKRAKTRPTNSGAMPPPLSVTVITALPSAERMTPVTTVVPGAVCLRALDRRLAMTW